MRHTGLTIFFTALALFETPLSASADDPEPRWYPDYQLGIGGLMNLGDMAGLAMFGGGFHADAELRVTPSLLVSLDYELLAGSGSDEDLEISLGMTQQRYGAKIRHPILGFGDEKLHGDYFVVAGGGRERTSWNEGGTLTRDYVVFGFGTSLTFARPHKGSDQSKWMMGRFGLRALVARAPDPGKVPAGCEGPCDSLTKTAPYDTTLILDLSLHFGGGQ